MNKPSVIKVQNLSKVYKLYNNPVDRLKEAIHPFGKSYHRDFHAVHDVSFAIAKGEMVGIIGKNGSGKSTLLKMLTGVLTPSAGAICIEGKISALLELGAGFNPEFTGMENIYFHGTVMGYSREAMQQKVDDILEFADIGDFIHQPVKTYSSGMFARLAFAVAINVDPDILIVDEALSVGDIFFQAKCYRKFNEFKQRGKTIIFVTHDMSSVIKYCDRAIILNNGVLVEQGPADQMVDIYKKILVNLYDAPLEQEIDAAGVADEAVWKTSFSLNPKCLEYGDGSAEIIDFAVFDDHNALTNSVIKGKPFQIKLKVKFNKTVTAPIIAFTIKDLKGTDITGTNTMLEDIDTGQIAAGGVIEVAFQQTLPLQGGIYLLSLGCTGFSGDDFTVYHRLYDVLELIVIANKNSVGFFDLNSKVSLRQLS
jgi:teichoic acid transport system ATP-binding protein